LVIQRSNAGVVQGTFKYERQYPTISGLLDSLNEFANGGDWQLRGRVLYCAHVNLCSAASLLAAFVRPAF